MLSKKYRDSPKNRDVISLFSGAMGLDIGLSQAGLNVKIGQDMDGDCVATMKANSHGVFVGDIRGISPEQLLGATGLSPAEPFLVCGGPPCQPFSTAGKRMGIDDPRGSLFTDFIRMIDHIRPRFFIMENVRGLMSASVKNLAEEASQRMLFGTAKVKKNDKGHVLEIVLSEFEKLGYKTTYGILDSVNYGVPQFRERFVLLGSRDGEDIFLPFPTHFQTHQDSAYQWVTLKTAIADLENKEGECTYFSQERLDFLRMVPEGGNWRDLPLDSVEKAMGGAYKSGGGKVGFFRRLSYSQPSPTLVTSPVQKASMLCHPKKDRPLSVREYARIQQFPDDWVFCGNIASKYRQIGNAVPIGLARALGKAIVSVAEGMATVKTKRVRGTDIHSRIKNAIEMGICNASQYRV
ncbi:MAG: DNA cytosine methyltransferase [Synergistaceae bacterium]|jgi:DNA (cytosine-5)-methyltransferase 1|nr:DNA cytosine methyltransferase [Synergistaceae bacterium]